MEETRPPRKVTIALIQNQIVLPTDAPISRSNSCTSKGLAVLLKMQANLGQCGVSSGSMDNALCILYPLKSTRGHNLQSLLRLVSLPLSEIAAIVPHGNSIAHLERDEDHGEILWNTAVIIDHGKFLGNKNHNAQSGILMSQPTLGVTLVIESVHKYRQDCRKTSVMVAITQELDDVWCQWSRDCLSTQVQQ